MSVAVGKIDTKIPARMDRLPWSRWHWLVVLSLGTVWILDGLEVTIKGAVGASLREAIGFSTVQVAGVASIYLFGAISGALFWAYLTDRFGRQKLFIITLAVYMVGVVGTSVTGLFPWTGEGYEYLWFAIFRFTTGFGIGGEYAAINSAIDELIPARVRGWVDLAINGSWWVGTAVGATLGAVYLNILPVEDAFRAAFGMGGILAIGILLLRLFVPESPRWLITHGRPDDAEQTVGEIEAKVKDSTGVDELPEPPDDASLELRERRAVGFVELGRTLFKLYPNRSWAGFSVMATQAFLYNAIFFTYGLMLTTFFGVSNANVGWFLVPFAVGNYLGPLILGRYFDTVGRKVMIPLTFWTAGLLTVITGLLFATEVIDQAWLMTLAWVVIFFFASAGASSGYLTVSETFPLEIRAMAIAFFYAIATAAGGVAGPILYGSLISGGERWSMFVGYAIGGGLMVLGGLMHRIFGVEAAQMELEDVAAPLSAEEAEGPGEGPLELEGAAGVDPSEPDSIRRFQREHKLEEDGVLGPRTARALEEATMGDGDGAGMLKTVDITNPEDIKRFQRAHGLAPDGLIGRFTRGAIRAAEARELVDVSDEESVRRFQREHGLEPDGELGPATAAAVRAVRSQRVREIGMMGDPDPLDRESIERFQRACALDPDGIIGAQTQGAIRAERARLRRSGGIDPGDERSIRSFQRAHGLREDGVIGPETQRAIVAQRESSGADDDWRRFGIDPADPDSIARFQREVGLDADGEIGPKTRAALRRAPHMLMEVDPTEAASIRRLQREHELEPDGVLGQETQQVLRTRLFERVDRAAREEDEAVDEDDLDFELKGLMAFDPTDGRSVERFQRDHGLEPDGAIGPRTQAALRAAFAETEQELLRRPPRGRARRLAHRHGAVGTGRVPAHLPPEDWEFEQELQEILAVMRDASRPMEDRELREATGARLWGPGRFKYVLDTATGEGILRQVGRRRYELTGRR